MQSKFGLAVVAGGALISLGMIGGAGSDAASAQTQPASAYIAASIERWNTLRANDSAPFESYASFLTAHRGWPGEAALRRTAEGRITPGLTGAADVLRYFAVLPPVTAQGRAYHALALQASGRAPEGIAAARQAWGAGSFPAEVEQRMLGVFGPQLTPADHDRRVDALLSEGDAAGARRMLAATVTGRRAVHEARLALQGRAPDALTQVAALGPGAATRDAGLLMDQLRYHQRTGNPAEARRLAAQRRQLAATPANPERFMELMVSLARGAAEDGQHGLAYGIASQVDDIYPAGTNVALTPFGERDEYTNLTWLAGTTALRNLGRGSDAVGMFERYGRASQSPQSRTKGLYWAGQSASVAGRGPQAQTLFVEAARNYDQFYGQLAADRLRQPLAAQAPAMVVPTPAQRQAFERDPLVAAVRYLGGRNWTQQTLFVRALAEHVRTDVDRQLAAELGRQIGRRDLGVLVSREARRTGASGVAPWGFPEVQVPPAHQRLWSVVHGITRQESLFDREALSSAGARGLMQLMPGTARQVSGQLGLPYGAGRLTSDPDYNVMLGSSYFSDLYSEWGSFPLAVASYNAGPGNVRRWIRSNGDPRMAGVDMVDWIERIPFTETRNYVQRVLENAVVYDLLYPQRATSPANGRLSFYLGRRAG